MLLQLYMLIQDCDHCLQSLPMALLAYVLREVRHRRNKSEKRKSVRVSAR